VETIKAILHSLSEYYSGEITIGEGPAIGSFDNAILRFGFESLKDEYNVVFKDLHKDEYTEITGVDRRLNPLKFCISKTLFESDFLISVAKPKTHDCVIATLSMKNIAVGALISKSEKEKIHQGTKAINLNIAKFMKHIMPDLGVVDGFYGMEGAGPVNGDPVRLGVSSASLNPVSLDAVMARVMGFNPLDIGYLHYLNDWGVGVADLDEIEVVGGQINEYCKKFKPHPTYHDQLKWK
jgi:uncharacterized protein (DUF362 family)